MRCKKCNYEILDNVDSCPACGTVININDAADDRCPNCKGKIDINMAKCSTCGFDLRTMNMSSVVIDEETKKKIGKKISKVILLITLIPFVPFILMGLLMLLIWLIGESKITLPELVVGLKYLFIAISAICFFFVFRNIIKKNNKIATNVVLSIVGLLFIAPIVFFTYIFKFNLVDIKADVNIGNHIIPTLYKYTEYDKSLLNIKLTLTDDLADGRKVSGNCIYSIYSENIPGVHINKYKENLKDLGFEYKQLEAGEFGFVKNNVKDFILINIDDEVISYCVVDGNFDDYKGGWNE